MIQVPINLNVFMIKDTVEAFKLPHKKGFNFLSIGKWEERKNWDTLLQAYWEEFDSEDDVAFFLRSSLDSDNQKAFNKLKANFLNQTGKQPSFS
jgi:hypothetical protein